jgi:hypothetical protein
MLKTVLATKQSANRNLSLKVFEQKTKLHS